MKKKKEVLLSISIGVYVDFDDESDISQENFEIVVKPEKEGIKVHEHTVNVVDFFEV